MEQFHDYSPEDIILSNLKEASIRHGRIFEQELAHLAELAKELVKNQPDESEILSTLPDFQLQSDTLYEGNSNSQSKDILKRLESIHAVEKKILLCDEIRKVIGIAPNTLPKGLLPPSHHLLQRYLEISFLLEKESLASQLLIAADLCGLSLDKIFSIPYNEGTDRSIVHMVFQVQKASVATFLLYLTMEHPQYNLIGIYTDIERKNND